MTLLWEGTNENKQKAIEYLQNISLGTGNEYFAAFDQTFQKLN